MLRGCSVVSRTSCWLYWSSFKAGRVRVWSLPRCIIFSSKVGAWSFVRHLRRQTLKEAPADVWILCLQMFAMMTGEKHPGSFFCRV